MTAPTASTKPRARPASWRERRAGGRRRAGRLRAAVAARARAARSRWSSATPISAASPPAAWCWCSTTCTTATRSPSPASCMEMIERMAKVGACVYPPRRGARPEPRRCTANGRAGAPSTSAPRSSRSRSCFAAAFDPDGWKRVSNDMVARGRRRSAAALLVLQRDRAGRPHQRRHLRDQGRPPGDPGRGGDRHHRRPRRRGLRRRQVHRRRLHRHHGVPPRRRRHRGGRALRRRGAGELRDARPPGQAHHRRLLGPLVAEDAAARRRLVQLPAHDRLSTASRSRT